MASNRMIQVELDCAGEIEHLMEMTIGTSIYMSQITDCGPGANCPIFSVLGPEKEVRQLIVDGWGQDCLEALDEVGAL